MHKKILLVFLLLFIESLSPQYSFAQNVLPFEGQVDFTQKSLKLTFNQNDQSSITLDIVQSPNGDVSFAVNADNVKLPGIAVSTVIEGSMMINEDEKDQKVYTGKVTSEYSLINAEPIRELSGRFEIRDNQVHLHSMSVGNIDCQGVIGLSDPYKVNLRFHFSDIQMENFIAFWTNGMIIPSAGLVAGDIKVLGELDRLVLKGELSSSDGHVKDLAYDSMNFNAEGVYPIIQLYNSTISETSGLSFEVHGKLNLAQRDDFKKQITTLTKSPIVDKNGSHLEWTLKRVKDGDAGATELKYMLKKQAELGASDRAETGMLGIERKIQF